MKKIRNTALALILLAAPILNGCDDGVRATTENGIISSSTSLFAAFLRASIDLALEANTPPEN